MLFAPILTRPLRVALFMVSLGVLGQNAAAQPAEATVDALKTSIDERWTTELYRARSQSVRNFPLPLGAMKKVRGVWQLDESVAVSGELTRTTWSVRGEEVTDLFESLLAELGEGAELRWRCIGRSCGNAAEWASRVYQERLLYGRDEYMRYAAIELPGVGWLTLFCAARTADRQYLHLDVFRVP